MAGEEVERRCVRQVLQGLAQVGAEHLRIGDLLRVRTDQRLGQQVFPAVGGLHVDVGDLGVHRDREVGRQGPRGRRPDQRVDSVEGGQRTVGHPQRHRDGDRRVLPHPVGIVELGLLVGQRRLLVPAVGQHSIALVDEPLVVERLERPHHRLHEVEIECLVVVVEVDPAGLAGHVVTPLPRVPQHRVAAVLVELRHAHLLDLRLVGDPELPFGLQLGRQTVCVPAESAVHLLATHGLVPGYQILDVTGQQVTVVRQAVRERRTVVEDELLGVGPVLDRRGEGRIGVPVLQDPLFHGREVGGAAPGAPGHVDLGIHPPGLSGGGLGGVGRVAHGSSPRAW